MKENRLIELVERIKQQDETAFEELYKMYYGTLYQYVIKLVNYNNQDAQEIIQDTFYSVWNSIDQLQLAEYFPLWMKRIAHNKAVRMFEKNHKKGNSVDPDVLSSIEEKRVYHKPHSLTFNNVERKELLRLVSMLPRHYQEIIYLYYFEDLTIKEIQMLLNTSEGTVKSRVFHARKKLKELIEAYEAQEDRKINFYINAYIPVSLSLFIKKVKQFMKSSVNKVVVTQVCAVGVFVYAGVQTMQELPHIHSETSIIQDRVEFEPVYFRGMKVDTASQAYYLLKYMISDEAKMEKEDVAVLEEIKPIIQAVLKSDTNYKQELEHSKWLYAYTQRVML